ncbi:TIGR02680 family protein [Ornithinibacillus gellani]|uniref:TIGR02680 family protein n=1 Tax=Ornithinibacillus gellani TaxID=2293253 RepID=UPI000F486935|nr:TIGR02680 family protein [Ornithinibacillus gellani]TQS75903.1 TIGR02680 family protein [Ornithinibacillus gellani]
MEQNKWIANRVGLINFWYYDEQIYEFSDGKMLLRGSNGSGKSVTMQSLLPVLLDGRTEPSRLDSFKSKSRRMEDYLLGEEQISKLNERTGYLFMEFKRVNADRYMTIGIGLQAKRGSGLKKWYFGITDGRRIGEHFSLYDQLSGEDLQPLSQRQLINRIGTGGKVMTVQKEYQQFVNDRIFGFKEMQQFEDCLALLIELRSPKLSRDFRPTVIYSILTNSLPALKEDDLQPVSRSLEQIDESRQRLEQLEREQKAIEKINASYERLYQEKLTIIAHKWQEAEKLRQQEADTIEKHQTKLAEIDRAFKALQQNMADLNQNMDIWESEKNDLQQHEAYQLVAKGEELKEQLQEAIQSANKWKQQWTRKQDQFHNHNRQIEQYEADLQEHQKQCEAFLSELQDHAQSSGFQQRHEQHYTDMERLADQYDYTYWQRDIRTYRNHLKDCVHIFSRLDELRKEMLELDKLLGDCNEKVETARQQERHWQMIFTEEKERIADALIGWRDQAPFSIPEIEFQEVLRRLEQLYEEVTRFSFMLDPIIDAKNTYIQTLANQLAPNRAEQKITQENIEEVQRDIEDWQTKKDPVPYRTKATEAYREQLKETGIQAHPFYDCIDFQDHVDDTTRNRLEAALLESGLLDALVADGTLQLKADRQILPKPLLLQETLADYLTMDANNTEINERLITSLLQSIAVEANITALDSVDAPVIALDGSYRLENIIGMADPQYLTSFIGQASRTRFREEKIKALMAEKEKLAEQLHQLQETERELLNKQQLAETALEQLPDEENLRFANTQLEQSVRQMQILSEEAERHQKNLESKRNEQRTSYADMMQLTKTDNIEKTLIAYHEAEQAHTDYTDAFQDWITELERMRGVKRSLEQAANQLLSIEEDLERAEQDYKEMEQTVQDIENRLASNKEMQKLQDVEKIKLKIETCIRNLKQGKEQLKTFQSEQLELQREQSSEEKTLEIEQEKFKFDEPFAGLWKETFESEVHRYETAKQDLQQFAKQLTTNWELVDKRLITLNTNFESAYRENEGDLLDYRLRINQIDALETPDWLQYTDHHQHQDKISVWEMTKQMKIMEVNTDGAWRSPSVLQQSLLEQIDEVNLVLRKSDEELFEEIIFHSVGNILRALIKKGQRWVDQMNQILLAQDNSSGLALSLKWKPKAADSEEMLSTSELVKLLLKDTSILKDADIEKIKYYFQEKIAQAKIQRDESEDYESLYQVLQEVLDYRQWFSFELHYSKGFPNKVELTNTRFNRFSGGEKATAMYLPLFTAMYSRYQDANADAPYLITLDEAFAGIDDLNISELFKAMEQLEFNYMINSQALYGEYPTVTSINTYELIRPNNADTVSTLLYHWDGKTSTIIPPKELMHDGAKS